MAHPCPQRRAAALCVSDLTYVRKVVELAAPYAKALGGVGRRKGAGRRAYAGHRVARPTAATNTPPRTTACRRAAAGIMHGRHLLRKMGAVIMVTGVGPNPPATRPPQEKARRAAHRTVVLRPLTRRVVRVTRAAKDTPVVLLTPKRGPTRPPARRHASTQGRIRTPRGTGPAISKINMLPITALLKAPLATKGVLLLRGGPVRAPRDAAPPRMAAPA